MPRRQAVPQSSDGPVFPMPDPLFGSVPSQRAECSLFSDQADMHSHSVRLFAATKNSSVQRFDLLPGQLPPAPLQAWCRWPPGSSGRTLLLYNEHLLEGADVIMDLLDLVFPLPSMLPAEPRARASIRQFVCVIERTWVAPLSYLLPRLGPSSLRRGGRAPANDRERTLLRGLLSQVLGAGPLLGPRVLDDTASLDWLDCVLLPVLFRLHIAGWLPQGAARDYTLRLLHMDCCRVALSQVEIGWLDDVTSADDLDPAD